jgi:hypothetical protein
MLRFLSERRAWVVAAFIVLMFVTGLWIWLAPRVITHVSALIGERFGVDAAVEEAHLSFGGVELAGVTLQGRYGGFVARIAHLDLRMNLLGAAFHGSKSVRALSARGVEVAIDLSDGGFADSVATLRIGRPGESSGAKGASRGGRTYAITDLALRIADAEGPLFSMRDASLQKEDSVLRSSIGETLLGESNADHAAIGPSTLTLRRTNGVWRLDELDIDGASVRSLRNGGGSKTALALRIREAAHRLRPTVVAPRVDDPEPESTKRTPPISRVPSRLFDSLTPEAHLAVSGVQIESATSGGHVERIRDLEWSLRGGGNGWYRVLVGGQTSNKGTLKVDLSVMPRDARAEGTIHLRRISVSLIAPFAPELPLYNTDVGTVSAELDLEASSTDAIRMEGGLQLRELALSSEKIAPQPVENINVDLAGKGTWNPRQRLLQIERGRVRMGKAVVWVEGELERTDEYYRVDLTAQLPPTPCNDVVGAVPKDMLASLAQFEWSGNWSAVTHISLDSRDLEATDLSIRVRNLCQFVRVPDWVRVERFQKPFRHRVIEPDDTVFEMRTGPGTANWVAFADISPFVPAAVISHEDGAFYEHGGFAPWAIRDALVRNLQEGRYVVGASTISMQLAKNLYLEREKTIARKVQEVILTWWLENALDKDQILELYLNVIEYGPGVYGLRNAAAYYFGREPEELSPAESAFLACMLPAPKRYHLSYERGALTRSMKSKMRSLLEHMAKRERIGAEALAYGLAELEEFHFRRAGDPLPPARTLPPLGAPQTSEAESPDPYEAVFVTP